MSRNKIIGAVEIGTSKVVVFVAELAGDQSVNLIGYAKKTSAGIKKGEIIDFNSASKVTHAAIAEAEKNAGVNIDSIYLSLSGAHLEGTFNRGSAHVSSHDGRVSEQDVIRAVDDAKSKRLPEKRLYVNHIRNPYLLDRRTVQSPVGMQGDNLEVGFWTVHGDESTIGNYLHIVNGFGLDVDDLIISSICSGEAVVFPAMKDSGALVIDIGRGTTDYALYRNGYIIKTGVVCVGGDHFTNDLSMGLRISPREAEDLKKKEGTLIDNDILPKSRVWLRGDFSIGDREIPERSIYQILKARGEELFNTIKYDLRDLLNTSDIAGGIVLTGGGALLRGTPDLSSEIFGMQSELGYLPNWVDESLRTPENSTTLGLLLYAARHNYSASSTSPNRGLFGMLRGIFNSKKTERV
jgi:cell division protein FtsA